MAADPGRGLGIISYPMPAGTAYFGAQQGFVPDNNATGQLAVVNLRTGATLSLVGGVQGSGRGGPLMHGALSSLIQLDPGTRTGWTFGWGAQQIQQFSY
jgi:hypothetical protein